MKTSSPLSPLPLSLSEVSVLDSFPLLSSKQLYTSSPLSLSEVPVSDLSPSLPANQPSPDSILSCNVYFAIKSFRHFACGGGDGGGGGGVSSLHTRICVIVDFRFAGFISSSGNCCPMNHKGSSCPPSAFCLMFFPLKM